MRALVADAGTVSLRERPRPTAGPGEVVVRTTAASLCSADVNTAEGGFDVVAAPENGATPPSGLPTDPALAGIVLGHEAVGTVFEIGAGVTGFEIGQRVLSASTTPCGTCADCQRGYLGHCGGQAWGGYTAGVTRDGTLAEYFVVPHAQLNLAHIPDAVSDAGALLVTDTLSSGSSGIEAASLPLGGTVVIIGQGHVGLGATLAAGLSGAGLVITVKASPGGEEFAQGIGADYSFNLREHDVLAEVLRFTGGAGADLVVEASGVRSAFALAVQLTRLGGEISVLGTYTLGDEGDETLPIPLGDWGWGVGDKKILTTFQRCGSERVGRLLRLVEHGRVDPAPFFTGEYPFADIQQAFSDLSDRSRGMIKPLIVFPGTAAGESTTASEEN